MVRLNIFIARIIRIVLILFVNNVNSDEEKALFADFNNISTHRGIFYA